MDEEARRQLQNVVFCDRKLEELRNESAIIQTARNAYCQAAWRGVESGFGLMLERPGSSRGMIVIMSDVSSLHNPVCPV